MGWDLKTRKSPFLGSQISALSQGQKPKTEQPLLLVVLSSLVNFEPKRVKEARARAPRKRDFGLLLKIWPNMAFLGLFGRASIPKI